MKSTVFHLFSIAYLSDAIVSLSIHGNNINVDHLRCAIYLREPIDAKMAVVAILLNLYVSCLVFDIRIAIVHTANFCLQIIYIIGSYQHY